MKSISRANSSNLSNKGYTNFNSFVQGVNFSKGSDFESFVMSQMLASISFIMRLNFSLYAVEWLHSQADL